MKLQRNDLTVIKKDGTRETFNGEKIVKAIGLSAKRVMEELSDTDNEKVVLLVLQNIRSKEIPILSMHSLVEEALDVVNPKVAKSYRDYRNYKNDYARMLSEVYSESELLIFGENRDNANSDSDLVSTKRSLVFNALEKRLYTNFFLSDEEKQADREGYIYIHDKNARRLTINCCLFDMENVLKGGFTMGNLVYNEPQTLSAAFDVMGDIILNAAAQQYGGFTIPEIDKVLGVYAEKSYTRYVLEYREIAAESGINEDVIQKAHKYALRKIERDFEQGWQGIEYKLNSVGSSRGDYPFVTVTFGLGTQRFERMCSITMLQVLTEGQGKPGHKVPVLFPKYVFLYDKALHGKGCINYDVFEAGLSCSAKTMYPDWLSLTGEGYVAEIYKNIKKLSVQWAAAHF